MTHCHADVTWLFECRFFHPHKILPEAFAHDADRLARFQREAMTLASLNRGYPRPGSLLEYRFFYGDDSDRLCVVVNGAITDRRRVFLENLGVAVVVIDGDGEATAIGQLAQEWFGRPPFQPRQPAEVST